MAVVAHGLPPCLALMTSRVALVAFGLSCPVNAKTVSTALSTTGEAYCYSRLYRTWSEWLVRPLGQADGYLPTLRASPWCEDPLGGPI